MFPFPRSGRAAAGRTSPRRLLPSKMFPATLAGHACLPGLDLRAATGRLRRTIFDTSGRFHRSRQPPRRQPLHARGADLAVGRGGAATTEEMFLHLPVGQPACRAFSGRSRLCDAGTLNWWTDHHGFRGRAPSADALLMFHHVTSNWEAGPARCADTTFPQPIPTRVALFPITTEAPRPAYLTGADFDLESIPADPADRSGSGEEFPGLTSSPRPRGAVVALFRKPRSRARVVQQVPERATPLRFPSPRLGHLAFLGAAQPAASEGMAASPDGLLASTRCSRRR